MRPYRNDRGRTVLSLLVTLALLVAILPLPAAAGTPAAAPQAASILASLSGEVVRGERIGSLANPDALGWVGNMFPAGGSSNTITAGGSFDVYVQVWKNGVTNAPGQGANITCTLHWGQVASFGGGWSNVTSTPMSYHGDIGNNDEYKGTISPPAGLYEFTAYCTDTTDNTNMWQGSGNGRLTVNAASASITGARAMWLDTNTIAWNAAPAASYRLLYDPDGGLTTAAEATACTFPSPAAPCYVTLTASGTVSGYPQEPQRHRQDPPAHRPGGRRRQVPAQGPGGGRQLRRRRRAGRRHARADPERAGRAVRGQRQDANPGRDLQRRRAVGQGLGAHGQVGDAATLRHFSTAPKWAATP